MKNNPTSFDPGSQPAATQGPIRKPVWLLVALIALCAVALIVFNAPFGTDHPVRPTSEAGKAPKSGGSNRGAERGSPDSVALRAPSPDLTLPKVPPPIDARDLVRSLSEIRVQPGELTPEKADKWRENILMLINQGTEAVPAVEDFLQSNVDQRFDTGSGTNLLGEPTLRIALIKVLLDIPAPANVELQGKLLRTTNDPDEIALLARQLELQEPGKFREASIKAASAALVRVGKGGFPSRYTTQLVELLQELQAAGAK